MQLEVHWSIGRPELFVRKPSGLGTIFSLQIPHDCQVKLARVCLLDSLNNGDREAAIELLAELQEAVHG